MHKDEKLQFLEPNMKIRDYVFNVSEASKKLFIHTLPVKLCGSEHRREAVRHSPQQHIVFTFNNHPLFFKFHDESIVDFNPGGRNGSCSLLSVFDVLCLTSFRLWWMSWDKGRKMVIHGGTFLTQVSPFLINTIPSLMLYRDHLLQFFNKVIVFSAWDSLFINFDSESQNIKEIIMHDFRFSFFISVPYQRSSIVFTEAFFNSYIDSFPIIYWKARFDKAVLG